TLIDILHDTARRYPDAPALDDGTVQLTYAELLSDVEDSVAWLGGVCREQVLAGDLVGSIRGCHGYKLLSVRTRFSPSGPAH
ncbi:hypothetical protein C6A85_13965, partial [Mycobacterium sp. ITM-2017-0098]